MAMKKAATMKKSAMKAMKAAKPMKAMKSMKKAMKAMKASSMKKMKAMKVSKIAKGKRARASVFRGTKEKTQSGLKKTDLKKNKNNKIVSVKRSNATKKGKGYKKIMAWANAVKQARKALGIKGFCAVGGKNAQGKQLLAKVRSIYKK